MTTGWRVLKDKSIWEYCDPIRKECRWISFAENGPTPTLRTAPYKDVTHVHINR